MDPLALDALLALAGLVLGGAGFALGRRERPTRSPAPIAPPYPHDQPGFVGTSGVAQSLVPAAPLVPTPPITEDAPPPQGRLVAQKPPYPTHNRCACGAPGLACPVHTPRR